MRKLGFQMNNSLRNINIFVILFTVLLILSSCDIVDAIADVFNGEDDDITDSLINSTTIGSDGGVVNADELTLIIPAGAFSQAVNIDIYLSSDNDSITDDIATKVYKIEGIPDQYSKPIDVRIKHIGNLSEQTYLILQEETYIPSLNSINTNNILFEAVVDGDSIKSQIPAMTADLAKVASIDDIHDGGVWQIHAVDKKKNHTTSSNHFNIIYTSSIYASHNDEETDVIALGQYLEDAYTKIQRIGFSYEKRTNWPIIVNIENFVGDEKNANGLHCTTLFGTNYYYLKFNRLSLNNQRAMKVASIHEFFHIVQYLYDNRNFFSKAKFKPTHFWFNEACSVYSEELVMGPNYVSDVRITNAMQPFYGLQAGSVEDAEKHGYGMSAFVHYLVKKHGQGILVDIYHNIEADIHIVNSINNSINETLFLDYNEFLQQYAQGEIYSTFGLGDVITKTEGSFDINSDTDILKTFTANYKGLSGKFYLVQLGNTNFSDDASLEISIDQDLCDITVFQHPTTIGSNNLLAEGMKSCTVSDLKGLKQQKKRLLIMVTNGNFIKTPSYSPSNKDITVRMEVKEKEEDLEMYMAFIEVFISNVTGRRRQVDQYGGDWFALTGGGLAFTDLDSGYEKYGGSGSITNNVYTGPISNYYQNERTVSGNMQITFIDEYHVNIHVDKTEMGNDLWDGGDWTWLVGGLYQYESSWVEHIVVDYNGIPGGWDITDTYPAESLYPNTDIKQIKRFEVYDRTDTDIKVSYMTNAVINDGAIIDDTEYLSHSYDGNYNYIEVLVFYK